MVTPIQTAAMPAASAIQKAGSAGTFERGTESTAAAYFIPADNRSAEKVREAAAAAVMVPPSHAAACPLREAEAELESGGWGIEEMQLDVNAVLYITRRPHSDNSPSTKYHPAAKWAKPARFQSRFGAEGLFQRLHQPSVTGFGGRFKAGDRFAITPDEKLAEIPFHIAGECTLFSS